MASSRHQEALYKASQLFDNGFSGAYIYEKLLKEGFSEEEARASVEALTQKPLNQEELAGFNLLSPLNRLILGIALLVIGLVLSFVLPEDWRILAYLVLVSGPIVILSAALRTS